MKKYTKRPDEDWIIRRAAELEKKRQEAKLVPKAAEAPASSPTQTSSQHYRIKKSVMLSNGTVRLSLSLKVSLPAVKQGLSIFTQLFLDAVASELLVEAGDEVLSHQEFVKKAGHYQGQEQEQNPNSAQNKPAR